jgi:hypothetical protein
MVFSYINFPQAPEIPKFAEIFASQGVPPVSTTLALNLPPVPLVYRWKIGSGRKLATGEFFDTQGLGGNLFRNET